MDQTADGLSLEALRALHAGQIAEGGALYRRALEAPGGHDLPVARHLRLLEGSGRPRAAVAVRTEALRAGLDLSSGLITCGGDPRAAMAEYEPLFASGVANAQMVANYLVALSRAGEAGRLAAIADPALLFRRVELPVEGDREAFLARVADALLHAETREFQESRKSLRAMERVLATHRSGDADLRTLHRAVRGLVERYISEVAASPHLIAPWIQPAFHLHSWGVISNGGGHSAPHIHAGGWVVAVAYIAGGDLSDGLAGAMQVGAGLGGDPDCAGWPRETVAPIPGTVIIMPAFYTHWTVPTASLRISVAFNAAEMAAY